MPDRKAEMSVSVDAAGHDKAIGGVVDDFPRTGPRILPGRQRRPHVSDSAVGADPKLRSTAAIDVDDGSPNDEHLGSLAQCWDKNDAGRGGSR